MVGSSGLEPPTSRLSGVRSNHLSYEPVFCIRFAPLAQFSAFRSFCGPLLATRLCCVSVLAVFRDGGDEQNRTVDPLLARQVLSQLSYAPILGLCLGESTPFEFSLFGGPSKLNSVRLTSKTHKYLFRSTWMFEHLVDARFSIERR